jgi:uncharacterized repeat protein (TIGR01451 family)
MTNHTRIVGMRQIISLAAVAALLALTGTSLAAEPFVPPVHHGWAGVLVPGAMGSAQLERGGPLPGYFQPVQIIAPPGATISVAIDNEFAAPMRAPVEAGMLIGSVYRLRVMRIPHHEGLEVFPTIEVVDRMYPPRGQELRFPIPVELTQEDLELASRGSFVTRVVYLENPANAMAVRGDAMHQNWFDAPPGEDPFTVASGMGRPMAILRIGSRTPADPGAPDAQFMYNSPPLLLLADADHPLSGCAKGEPLSKPPAAEPSAEPIPAPRPKAFAEPPALDAPVAPEPPPAEPASESAIIRGQEPASACPGPAGLPEEAYRGYPGDGYTQAGYVPQFMRPGGQPDCTPVPYATFGPWRPSGIDCPWPKDEYICDGGERAPGVRVRANSRIDGLQVEDTFVHYDTIDGRTLVQPSNRVCIYAPRFGVVRKVDLAREGDELEALHKVNQPVRASLANESELATASAQPVGPIDEVGLKPVLALVDKQKGVEWSNRQVLAAVYDRIKPYEDFSYFRSGILLGEDKPILAERVQAALVWSAKQGLEVVMEGKRASAVTGDIRAEAEFVVDVPNHPRLQICKIASRNSALPGETVDFSIRFDNVGDQKIGNVTIIDSLTTRLEYVAGSAQSSTKAAFSTQPNEAGSTLLKWDFIDPVPANGGGAVHFQCRVR